MATSGELDHGSRGQGFFQRLDPGVERVLIAGGHSELAYRSAGRRESRRRCRQRPRPSQRRPRWARAWG